MRLFRRRNYNEKRISGETKENKLDYLFGKSKRKTVFSDPLYPHRHQDRLIFIGKSKNIPEKNREEFESIKLVKKYSYAKTPQDDTQRREIALKIMANTALITKIRKITSYIAIAYVFFLIIVINPPTHGRYIVRSLFKNVGFHIFIIFVPISIYYNIKYWNNNKQVKESDYQKIDFSRI